MPKKTIEFKYSHGDRIQIIALGAGGIGIVECLSASVLTIEYRVAYWHEGRRYLEWLREDEITTFGN